jgi:hypothetical protein
VNIYQKQAIDGRWWWVIDTKITALSGKHKTRKSAAIALQLYLEAKK